MNRLSGVILCVTTLLSTTLALYSSGSDVVDLTATNFERLVEQSDQVWIVEFYAPWCGHCKALAPEYSKAASALKGVVKLGGVNCDNEKSLASRFGIRGFPSIKIFGANKQKPDDYNGGRTADGLIDEALATITRKVKGGKRGGSSSGSSSKPSQDIGKDVVILTDENFESLIYGSRDSWLVEFYAPGCGFCERLKPEWAEAATSLKGKVKLGAMDATVQTRISKEYNIEGFPTILWFEPGTKRKLDALPYDGGRTSVEIINWVVDKLQENAPPPESVQLTDNTVFKEQCESSPLCVVSILPHLLDCQSDCRRSYLDMLKKMADKYKKKLWGWVWAEAGTQSDLEEKLDIGGFGYPAMAVLNSKKLKFSLLRGSFSPDGIGEFLRDLSFGRGQTRDIRSGKLPEVTSTEEWNGDDFDPVEETDEDIDLSDVVLDDLKDEL